jgi:hypothetical protein
MNARCRWLAVLLLPLLWGCAAAGSAPGSAGEYAPRSDRDVVEVRVENASADNLVILAEQGGMQKRLGVVMGAQTASFRVPADGVSGAGLRLMAQPTSQRGSGAGLRSGPVVVTGGEVVIWRLRDRPGISDVPHQVSLRVY